MTSWRKVVRFCVNLSRFRDSRLRCRRVYVCVCVCVCARARVCVCARARRARVSEDAKTEKETWSCRREVVLREKGRERKEPSDMESLGEGE